MRYASIKEVDIANGDGCRVSLFLQGCSRHCHKCFNPETWDFGGGKLFDNEAHGQLMDALNKTYIHGLSVLGGEPMEQARQLKCLLQDVKSAFPDKTIWLYTGYTYEALADDMREVLPLIDVLVDGEFIEAEKVIDLRFRGSTNQRIIDVQKTISNGMITLYELSDWSKYLNDEDSM